MAKRGRSKRRQTQQDQLSSFVERLPSSTTELGDSNTDTWASRLDTNQHERNIAPPTENDNITESVDNEEHDDEAQSDDDDVDSDFGDEEEHRSDFESDDEAPEQPRPANELRSTVRDLESLEEVAQQIDDWRNKPEEENNPCQASFNVLRPLIAAAASHGTALPESRNEIVMVGEQSAGKTSLMCSLSAQVNFIPHSSTGTRVRTLVRKEFTTGDRPTNSLSHTGGGIEVFRKDLNNNDLFQEYQTLTARIKADCRRGFSSGQCEIVTKTPDPEFGLTVLDHPGIHAGQEAGTLIELSNATLLELFPQQRSISSRPSNAKVLVTVAYDSGLDFMKSNFLRIKELKRVPKENLIIVVNKMDNLIIKEFATAIREAEGCTEDKIIRKSPWELLSFIKQRLVQASQGFNFKKCEFYFTSSASLGNESLASHPPDERWKLWKESQLKNTLNFLRILGVHDTELETLVGPDDTHSIPTAEENKEKWKDRRIHIKDMSERENKLFKKYVGAEALRSALLKHQYRSAVDLAQIEAEQAIAKGLQIEEQAAALRKELQMFQSGALGGNVLSFMRDLVETYHTLESGHLSSDNPFKTTYDSLEKVSGWGWTLADETKLTEKVSKSIGEFPPTGHGHEDFEKTFKDSKLRNMEQNGNLSYHTPSLLINRTKQELVNRAMHITVDEINPDSILVRSKNISSGVEQKEVSGALSDFIAVQYESIYGTEGSKESQNARGTRFISHRTGLAFLLPCEAVLAVICQAKSEYASMFATTSGVGNSKLLPHSPLRLPDNFHEASKFLNGAQLLQPDRANISISAKVTSSKEVPLMDDQQFYSTFADDIVRTLVAMFYDRPFEAVRKEFTTHARVLKQMQPSFLASVLQNAPIFLHHDKEYREWYAKVDQTNEYVQSMMSLPSDASELLDNSFLDLVQNVFKPLAEKKNKSGDVSKGNDVFYDLFESIKDKIGDIEQNSKRLMEQRNKKPSRPKDGKRKTAFSSSSSSNASSRTIGQDQRTRGASGDTSSNGSTFAQASTFMTRIIHALDATKPDIQRNLMIALLRLNRGPDLMITPQSQDSLTEEEKYALEYLVRRYISAANFLTVLSMVRLLTNMLYEYGQVDQTNNHYEELVARLTSLMLGYDYPYATHERPQEQQHLEPERIVVTLYRIVEVGEETVMPHEHASISCSPVIRWILDLHSSSKDKDRQSARHLVQSMYRLVLLGGKKNLNSFHELLIREMASSRYKDTKQEEKNDRIRDLKRTGRRWEVVASKLISFADVLKEHGERIALHLNDDKEGNPLPDDIKKIKPSKPLLDDAYIDDDQIDDNRPAMPSYQFRFSFG